MRAAYLRARSAYYECRGDYGARLAHMIENRNEWRAAATRLVIDHRETDKGRCGKCNQSFPCESVKILTRVNRGFARKVETLAGFSDVEWSAICTRGGHPRPITVTLTMRTWRSGEGVAGGGFGLHEPPPGRCRAATGPGGSRAQRRDSGD